MVSIDDASRRSQQARHSNAARRARKVILTFPRFKIVMLTQQGLNSGDKPVLQSSVFYKFTSSFRDPIGVSTDRREYSRLREVLDSLKLEQGKPADARFEIRQFEKDERDGTPGFVLEPQLDIMGEATSTVLDWFLSHLDIDKTKLPKHVHLALADPLESVLASVCQVSATVDTVFEKASAEFETSAVTKGSASPVM